MKNKMWRNDPEAPKNKRHRCVFWEFSDSDDEIIYIDGDKTITMHRSKFFKKFCPWQKDWDKTLKGEIE